MTLAAVLFEGTLRASAVMLAALIAVAFLRNRSAALRHWILSAAIVAAMAAPFLTRVTPSWRVPLVTIERPRLLAVAAPAARVEQPRASTSGTAVAPAPGRGSLSAI